MPIAPLSSKQSLRLLCSSALLALVACGGGGGGGGGGPGPAPKIGVSPGQAVFASPFVGKSYAKTLTILEHRDRGAHRDRRDPRRPHPDGRLLRADRAGGPLQRRGRRHPGRDGDALPEVRGSALRAARPRLERRARPEPRRDALRLVRGRGGARGLRAPGRARGRRLRDRRRGPGAAAPRSRDHHQGNRREQGRRPDQLRGRQRRGGGDRDRSEHRHVARDRPALHARRRRGGPGGPAVLPEPPRPGRREPSDRAARPRDLRRPRGRRGAGPGRARDRHPSPGGDARRRHGGHGRRVPVRERRLRRGPLQRLRGDARDEPRELRHLRARLRRHERHPGVQRGRLRAELRLGVPQLRRRRRDRLRGEHPVGRGSLRRLPHLLQLRAGQRVLRRGRL